MARINFGGVEEEVTTVDEFPLEKAREILKDENGAAFYLDKATYRLQGNRFIVEDWAEEKIVFEYSLEGDILTVFRPGQSEMSLRFKRDTVKHGP